MIGMNHKQQIQAPPRNQAQRDTVPLGTANIILRKFAQYYERALRRGDRVVPVAAHVLPASSPPGA